MDRQIDQIDQAAKPQNHDVVESLSAEIPYLRRYAIAMTHNRADADDLVQTCLLQALTRLDKFEPGTNLRAWLMAIMHNRFIDGFRKNKRAALVAEARETLTNGSYAPANQIHWLEVNDMQKALADLPAKQRSTLLLVALESMTYEEVAKITNVPVGTVRSRLSRARHTLMDMVDGRYTNETTSAPGADAALVQLFAKARNQQSDQGDDKGMADPMAYVSAA